MRRRGDSGIRYSRFVQGLRLLLPVITVVVVLLVALWPEFNSVEDAIAVSQAPISLDDAERLTMTNPRYTSRDESGMPYVITADLAEQMDTETMRMALTNPAADVTLNDGTWVMLRADSGHYSDQDKRLDLSGDVSLFHDAGYEFHTQVATIDFVAGRAEGDQPVAGFGSFGDIQSEGFVIEDRGAVIIFTGRAHMVLRVEEELPVE
ncbi:MAG: LPS export ABC transporter periplasmic protein LptC [Alphaproteobacteria bacterium]